MGKRILRNFPYLNDAIVDSYLAQLDGEFVVDTFTRKEATSGSKGGGVDVKTPFIGGSAKGDATSSSEVQLIMRETPEIKFTRLYELMTEGKMIQPLNGLDQRIYDQIQLDEIVEVRGKARLPEWEHVKEAISGFSYMVDLMKKVGQEDILNAEAEQAYEGFQELASNSDQDETVLIVAPIGSPKFKFVAKLDVECIRGRKERLEVEVTMLGQVLRRLAPGDTIDAYRLLPKMSHLKNLNRVQKRAAAKMPSTDTPLDEVIRYPAIQIQPIAIYQQVVSRQVD